MSRTYSRTNPHSNTHTHPQAFTYLESADGLALEADYPYEATDGRCKLSKAVEAVEGTQVRRFGVDWRVYWFGLVTWLYSSSDPCVARTRTHLSKPTATHKPYTTFERNRCGTTRTWCPTRSRP